jgi:calcium-dependent protein kinase
MRIKEFRAP